MRQYQALVPAVLSARYIRWRLKLEGETENMGVRWGARMMMFLRAGVLCMAGFDFFFSLPLDSLAFFALMHTVRTHFDLTAPLESAEVSSSLCVAFPCVVFLV